MKRHGNTGKRNAYKKIKPDSALTIRLYRVDGENWTIAAQNAGLSKNAWIVKVLNDNC